jgi:Transmembrane secretion effector
MFSSDEARMRIREVRLIHLRNGAYSWRLHEDLTRPNTFRLEMNVPSWSEDLLQKERMTKAARKGMGPSLGLCAAGGTDLPVGEQRAAHAETM